VNTKSALLLVNLGTPDAPTPSAVRRFLKTFLSDPRVVDLPRLLWLPLLYLFVLPRRPRAVAKLYQSIWQQDSPQRLHGEQLAASLTRELDMPVVSAMTYGKPDLGEALQHLLAAGCERLLVVPLFPQYSTTTTAAVLDRLHAELARVREVPALTFIKDYWQQDDWQEAIAAGVRAFQQQQGSPQKLLFSFHGIPQANEQKGERYAERCRASAAAIAARLGLQEDDWACAFQSRFGRAAWVTPYTDQLLLEWAAASVENVQVVCPGFAMDCLETLEEIALRNRAAFLAAGGRRLDYIPALNASAGQRQWLLSLARAWLEMDAHP
jgi:ferrochelatase